MPAVSVIIPTHNRAHMLKEAIASVLSQAYKDFELVVIDDGSTDDTQALLRSYTDIRVIAQEHRGVSAARNTGISASRGPLIAFLDSDDLWLPEKLTAQIDFFDTHPEAVICQTEETWVRKGVRVNPRRKHKKPSGMIFEHSVDLCLVSPSAVMMRRALLDQVGFFDETMSACEDYDLWLRVSCRFPIHLIDTPLVIKRGGHSDQLSQQPSLDRFRIYSLAKILDTSPPTGLTPGQRAAANRAIRKKCSIYAAGCLKRNRKEEAREYLELKNRFDV